MAKSKFVAANKKIADGVVGGYKKIEDAIVDQYLTHDGETVEDAKKRLKEEQGQRQAEGKERYNHQMEQTMEHVKKAHEKAVECALAWYLQKCCLAL